MSFNNNNLTPCDQMLPSIILYIDHEIFEDDQLSVVETHFSECPGCLQLMEQETKTLNQVRTLLCNALNEQAPEDLTNKINLTIEDIYNQMLILAITLRTKMTTSSESAAWRMRGENLLTLLK